MVYGFKIKLNKRGNLALYLAMITVVIATFIAIAIAPLPANAECSHESWSKTKHSEFFGKRMATLHEELKLSEVQEKAWTIFIEKSKQNEQHPMLNQAEILKLTTPERLDQMLSMMKIRQQNMEAHAQTVRNFYSILTSEQQKVFDASFHAYRVSMKNTKHLPLFVTT